ncbi:MAG TPA: kelch repeat-containing protein [Planctomycetota bacterium]|nr:kelch repeat-containing protein [Planctomycetota bacterium]
MPNRHPVLLLGALALALSISGARAVDTFVSTPTLLNNARAFHTATLLPNGKVLVAGGINQITFNLSPPTYVVNGSAELYDPVAGTWAPTAHTMLTARYNHAALLLPTGKVLLAGGYDRFDVALSSAELYDPATDTFTATAQTLTVARAKLTATLLANGKVLLAGGININGFESGGAELYDPVADTFTATGTPMAVWRSGHSATLLPSGKVLIAGGPVDEAELYDPAANAFALSQSGLAVARTDHTATLLANGKVLLAGGQDLTGIVLNSSELYDPAANTFTVSSQPMNDYRSGHTATLLADGTVLVTGGEDEQAYAVSSAELYDPASDTWSPTAGSMTATRIFHTATLLNNGDVLVAGGQDTNGNVQANSELYGPSAGGPAVMFTSVPTASPANTSTGELISFSAAATDTSAGASALTYAWNFGDGTGALGASTTHIYLSAGHYTVFVTVSDAQGNSVRGEVLVSVTGAPTKVLTITSATIKLNFAKPGNDSIAFYGSLDVPAGFVPELQLMTVSVGGVTTTFDLNRKGSAKTKNTLLRMPLQEIKGVTVAQTAPFYIALTHGHFASTLMTSGLTNATASDVPVSIPVGVTLIGQLYATQLSLTYNATQGINGVADNPITGN